MMRTLALVSAALMASACGGSSTPDAPRDASTPGDLATDTVVSADSDEVTPSDATSSGDIAAGDIAPVDATAEDATPGDVVSVDAAPVDAGPMPSICSRPLLPMSTARVSSQRPTLQLSRGPGLRETLFEVCRERDCRAPVLTISATDDYLSPRDAFAPGVYFWRLTARNAMGESCTGPTWQFTVPGRTQTLPRSWGSSLDLNGDGYADLAVATVGVTTGEVRIYHGSAMGLSDTPAATLTGLPTSAMGYVAAPVPVSAGDVNGDGFVDLAVGLPAANDTAGEVRVYLGGRGGVSTRATAELRGPDGAFGRFGASLTGVGDVEGDGYADLVVGAPNANATRVTDTPGVPGKIYVFHGLAAGIRFAPTTTIAGLAGVNALFGAALGSAGDVDADRFPDVIVGAPGVGRAFIYRGSALGLRTAIHATFDEPRVRAFGARVGGAGDLEGDNHADVFIAGESNAGSVVVRRAGSDGMFSGAATMLTGTGRFGQSVAAMDINGDGFSDLAIAHPDTNAVWVLRGGSSGVALPQDFTLTPAGTTAVGEALTSVGDVNRDGFSDLAVVGATGPVTVFHGAATGAPAMARTLALSAPVRVLAGATGGI